MSDSGRLLDRIWEEEIAFRLRAARSQGVPPSELELVFRCLLIDPVSHEDRQPSEELTRLFAGLVAKPSHGPSWQPPLPQKEKLNAPSELLDLTTPSLPAILRRKRPEPRTTTVPTPTATENSFLRRHSSLYSFATVRPARRSMLLRISTRRRSRTSISSSQQWRIARSETRQMLASFARRSVDSSNVTRGL